MHSMLREEKRREHRLMGRRNGADGPIDMEDQQQGVRDCHMRLGQGETVKEYPPLLPLS